MSANRPHKACRCLRLIHAPSGKHMILVPAALTPAVGVFSNTSQAPFVPQLVRGKRCGVWSEPCSKNPHFSTVLPARASRKSGDMTHVHGAESRRWRERSFSLFPSVISTGLDTARVFSLWLQPSCRKRPRCLRRPSCQVLPDRP